MTGIEIIDVARAFTRQATPAVDGISLQVAPGELLALLGPSGSGKSTLLKLIAGLEQPDRGDIRFDGQSVTRLAAHRRGAVLMFQKPYLFPFLSVGENIAFGLRLRGAPRQTIAAEVARMLALVELPGTERRRPHQLSGGEQQRIALARALVVQPRVLLLDEPFSSLDAIVRHTLQEAVRRIQRELGITAILVTHDQSEALAMADRIALIDHGRLLACDTPRRLFQQPPTRAAARLMGISTFLQGRLSGAILHTPLGCLELHHPCAQEASVTVAIRPEHLRLLSHSAPNAIAATVQAHTFRGDYHEYQLHAESLTLRARVFQPCAATVGDTVFVQLPPEHLFIVANDPPCQKETS